MQLILFDAQALLKNQKMALLMDLRGALLGGIGTLLLDEFWYFFEDEVFILVILILQAIQKSSTSSYFYHSFIFYKFFWKNKGLNFMKRLINKAFLMPSVEQLLGHQIDSWTSKTIMVIRNNHKEKLFHLTTDSLENVLCYFYKLWFSWKPL